MKFKTKSRKTRRKPMVTAINLPGSYPWKVLGWLASDLREYLAESDYKEIESIIRLRDVDSILSLSEDWGLQSMVPSGIPKSEKISKYLLASLLKKFLFPSERTQRVESALKKFREYETTCLEYNQTGYKALSWANEEWMVDVFTHARTFLQKLLGDTLPSHSSLTHWSRHGPGASLGTSNGDNSAYHKFANWPYSCTKSAFRYARFTIETDQRWFGALQDDYRQRFNIPKHMPLDMREFWTKVVKFVDGNRITFVPKNARTERSIAIEPTLNLYLQLGVDGFIRRRLKRYGVDLDDQSKNQEYARLGSITGGNESFVTIDLAGASDCVSLKLCELLLPPDWNSYLRDLRSPVGDLGGETISYEKISSMGNGFTFALESAIFTAIIIGVLKADKGFVKQGDFCVFGDDLIIAKKHSPKLIEALANCGFTTNVEKSFLHGNIRESCGTDWFQGTPVRPVFFDDTPTNVMELLTDRNRLKRILSLRIGLEESKTIVNMDKWIPEAFQGLKGPLSDESFDSHIHTDKPSDTAIYNFCMWKYKRLIVKPLPRHGNCFLFRKLMHDLRGAPIPVNKWDGKGAGSRFTVTRRNSVTVGYTYSVADQWRSQYTE